MPLPDYHGGSIVNLMSTIATACGGASPYAALRGLDPAQLAAKRNVVLLLVDGLGYNWLTRNWPDSVLCRHLQQRITSVFPSTTATAITTVMTGLAPQQHGLTGWHMYFRELDTVAAVLPFRTRATNEPLTRIGADPAALFDHAPIYDGLKVPAHVVAPQSIINTQFNLAHSGGAARHGYTKLPELFETIVRVLSAGSNRRFIYAYYAEIDALAHAFGIASHQVAAEFARLDSALRDFLTHIAGSDTTLVVTADHGFVDSPPACLTELDHHPELAAMLAQPLCGERRVAYCYVRPECHSDFERYVTAKLGTQATLHRSRDLISKNWFGPGAPHPRLAERVGDYTLVMKNNHTLKDWLPNEKRHAHIGVHGGISDDEMYVPLITAAV
jgi:predicted AlkP superfamily pyrophosphatase or phosphodiesterase